jgi:hypothetical protein
MSAPASLYDWTKPALHKACNAAYRAYYAAKTDRAKAYFAAYPELKDPGHDYKAKDITAALPPGWAELAGLIPDGLRHRHHLSGNSSQILALALLGAAARLDPSHDYLVEDDALVMCIECKWAEEGMGTCSCAGAGGDPATGNCRDAVLNHRPLYWEATYEVFGLPDRQDGKPCPLSPVYQAVRNVAAALHLRPAGGVGVFGLIYDADNPYFGGCGDWPGWPDVLSVTLNNAHPNLRFRAVSWQELMPLLELDDDVRTWARKKHGLGLGGGASG